MLEHVKTMADAMLISYRFKLYSTRWLNTKQNSWRICWSPFKRAMTSPPLISKQRSPTFLYDAAHRISRIDPAQRLAVRATRGGWRLLLRLSRKGSPAWSFPAFSRGLRSNAHPDSSCFVPQKNSRLGMEWVQVEWHGEVEGIPANFEKSGGKAPTSLDP